MSFCIPKQLASKLQEAAKRGEINIVQLYEMTSDQRRAFFKQYVDEGTAKGINAGFEQAILSEQQAALNTWAKNTFSIKDKARRKNVLDRIQDLEKEGALTPKAKDGFLQDLVAEKLGVTISPEEAETIANKSKELEKAYAKPKDKFGLPDIEYFIKRREMDEYLQSLTPANQLKILTSTVGRGSMLFSLKSPLINITGNTVQSIYMSLERRVSSKQYRGVVDRELQLEYFNKVMQIYYKSRYDVTRLESLGEGAKTLGERVVHSQGKGAIRAWGRFYEDIVFTKLLSTPDVAFSAAAFMDSANLAATKLARSEGLSGDALKKRATELFLDSAAVEPKLGYESEALRSQAILDATTSTFQNDTVYSKVALQIRDVFNQASGDLRIGDQVIPFVKTVANYVGFGIDAAGVAGVRGFWNLPNAVSEFKSGNPNPMRDVARDFTRAGLGMTIGFVIANLIDPEDFLGKYPTNKSEQELLKLNNGMANSIRIGNRWVSLEYFGFLATPFVGFLYARKYGDSMIEDMYSYAAGVAYQTLEIPGLEQISGFYESVKRMKPEQGDSVQEIAGEVRNSAISFIRSRLVPGFVSDLAKAFDTAEREVDWNSPVDAIKAAIPGLRNTLPEKTDVFGAVIKGEPWYSVILFGSRIKTAREQKMVEEFRKLEDAGQLPSLTRPEKTSSRVRELKEQIGDEKFDQAMKSFKTRYRDRVTRFMDSASYDRIPDEEKKKRIDDIKSEEVERLLKSNGYRKPKDQASVTPNPLVAEVIQELKDFKLVPQAYAGDEVYTMEKDGKMEIVVQPVADNEKESTVTVPGGGILRVAKNVVGSVIAAIKRRVGESANTSLQATGDTIVFESDDAKKDTDMNKLDSPTEVKQVLGATDVPKVEQIDPIKVQKTPKKEIKDVEFNWNADPRIKFTKKDFKMTEPTGSVREAILEQFPDAHNIAAVIAKTESGLNPKTKNDWNPDWAGWDVGLFQINEGSYNDFVRRKSKLMEAKGIPVIKADTVVKVNPQGQKFYLFKNESDRKQWETWMYDPKVNAAMARIIYDEQGPDAWYGLRNNGIKVKP